MIKQNILLSTVWLGFLAVTQVRAECLATKDCSSLGYKQSSCDTGKGIKCPFGEAWYCPCDASYIYTCTGTNESPSTYKCGDKYSQCNCATGTHWDSGSCVSDRASCSIGDIYYTDNTCVSSAEHNSSKTVLGIVVHVNSDGVGGQIMAPWPIDASGNRLSSNTSMYWSTSNVNTSVPDITAVNLASTDYNSCENTNMIRASCDKDVCLAAWAAYSYAPTDATKNKWCLPAAGIMTNIYNNRDLIDIAISKVGGVAYPSCCTWSSSEYSEGYAWVSSLNTSYGLDDGSKDGN